MELEAMLGNVIQAAPKPFALGLAALRGIAR